MVSSQLWQSLPRGATWRSGWWLCVAIWACAHSSGVAQASSFLEATQARIVFNGRVEQMGPAGSVVTTGEIGTGYFTYSSTNTDHVYVSSGLPVFPVPPQIAITPDMNMRLVDVIQLSIAGIDFEKGFAAVGSGHSEFPLDYFWHLPLDAGDTFPDASSVGPRMVVESGPPGDVALTNEWDFGYSRETYLMMQADGTFLMVHPFPTSTHPQEMTIASGTWRAEPVPEPLTVMASLCAIAIGFGLQRIARRRQLG
ncbi:MAG: hypothetical protein KDA92_24125 [Planctomycetales bacterium]|nr:hypothetical protein [Planctomycetales bacterium]